LVPALTFERYRKFLALSATTRKALNWFEENAPKSGKGSKRSKKLMTGKTRTIVVREVCQFLAQLDFMGVEAVRAEDLPEIPHDGSDRKRLLSMFHHVDIFYKTCVKAGLLEENPLREVELDTCDEDAVREFLAPEMVERARDLSTVDMNDREQVVARTALLLLLDLALRLNELANLLRSHARRFEGGFRIHLPSEVQKMQGKPAVDIETLYPETAKMLAHYLKHYNTEEEGPLILNRSGKRASGTVISSMVRREAERIGVSGYYTGKTPSCHAFRRTFATCNAYPLGFGLPPDEIANRLRIDLALAYKVYVQQNPLIAALKNEHYRNLAKTDKRSKLLGLVQELEKAGVPPSQLETTRSWIDATHPEPREAHRVGQTWISEDEARERLESAWGCLPNWRTFKGFMKRRGSAIGDRPGKTLEYDEAVIRDLSLHQPLGLILEQCGSDWRARKSVVSKVTLLEIGRLKLVPPDDVSNALRALKAEG